MRMLAIELSSDQGSAAALENGGLVREVTWGDSPRLGQQVHLIVPRLLSEIGWGLRDVDVIAAGRGPGSYTGLRVALSYAHGLAMPAEKRLYAVQSSEALAAEIAESSPEPRIVILGDARRGMVWLCEFIRNTAAKGLRLETWETLPAAETARRLSGRTTVAATSDWTRLRPLADSTDTPVRWINENRYPRSAWVGRVVSERIAAGIPSDPFTPIYTHPPVAAPQP